MKRILRSQLNEQEIQKISKCKIGQQMIIEAKKCEIRKETAQVQSKIKTEKSNKYNFSRRIFDECFQPKNERLAVKPFHKLQYKSLEKSKISKSQIGTFQQQKVSNASNQKVLSNICNNKKINQYQNRLSENVSSKYSFPSTNQTKIIGKQNHLTFPHPPSSFSESKALDQNLLQKTQFHRNPLQKPNQQCQRLFLSQKFRKQITNKNQWSQIDEKCKTRKYSEDINQHLKSASTCKWNSDSFLSNLYHWNVVSTFDSYKIKQTLQTQQSRTTTPLQGLSSKLCESIKIDKSEHFKCRAIVEQAFQFDPLKDSLINKLAIFKQSIIPFKTDRNKKSFIRSRKNQGNQLNQSPKFNIKKSSPIMNRKLSAELSLQNEQDLQMIDAWANSKQTIQQKVNKYRFKSLDECGYTIVSKYNKSSDKDRKSILQESNIVFQASKMYPQNDENVDLPTFSDSQIVSPQDNENTNKQYNSFIHEFTAQNKSDIVQKKLERNTTIKKKAKSIFIRTIQRKDKFIIENQSSNVQTKQQNDEEIKTTSEIRFDLNTYFQYESL